jgi:hypothetical protein
MREGLTMWRCLRAHLLAMALLGSSALHAAPLLQLRVEAGEHQATVRRIAVSADGALVATASDDKMARLWRRRPPPAGTLRVPIGDGDQGRLYGVTFSPDGRQLAVAGTNGDPATPHRIDVFDAGNARHLRTLQLDAGHVVRLLWTRDGRHLAACLSGRDGLRIVAADSGQTVYSEAFAAPCFGLAELPDGSLLASGFDGQIRQLRSQGGRWQAVASMRTEIADPQAIAVAPDGLHFAVGYRSRLPSGDIAIDVFDAGKLTLARRFSFGGLRGGSLGSVAWSGDGRTLAAIGRAGADGQIVLKRITWPQGSVASDIVATTPCGHGAYGVDWFALASSNGSWALIPRGRVDTGRSVIDIRGADSLRADETLRALSLVLAAPGRAALRVAAAPAGQRQGSGLTRRAGSVLAAGSGEPIPAADRRPCGHDGARTLARLRFAARQCGRDAGHLAHAAPRRPRRLADLVGAGVGRGDVGDRFGRRPPGAQRAGRRHAALVARVRRFAAAVAVRQRRPALGVVDRTGLLRRVGGCRVAARLACQSQRRRGR